MEIVYKSINELIEYEDNPRKNNEAAVKVAESIKAFGFINPISITPGNLIISGNTRLKAARLLGLEQVPCIIHNLTDDDAVFAGTIDNKSAEYATWDIVKLQNGLSKNSISMPFFTSGYRDLHERKNDLSVIFGKNKIPVTESEYLNLKLVFDDYVNENKSYLGFIHYILRDKIIS